MVNNNNSHLLTSYRDQPTRFREYQIKSFIWLICLWWFLYSLYLPEMTNFFPASSVNLVYSPSIIHFLAQVIQKLCPIFEIFHGHFENSAMVVFIAVAKHQDVYWVFALQLLTRKELFKSRVTSSRC